MLLNLTHLSEEPLHRQVSRQLLEKILRNELPSGSELPNYRKLAREQHLSASVTERAYRELADEGFLTCPDSQHYQVPNWTAQEKQQIQQRLISEAPPASVVQQLAAELRTARQIQACLFPQYLPDDPQLLVAAHWQPASMIGGDFYDCFAIDEHHLALVIADACGKGLPAALLVAQLQAMLHSEARNGNGIRDLLAHLNDQIIRFSPRNQFVTLFYGVLDRRTGVLRYASAGHNAPLLVHADSRSEILSSGGPGLGIMAQAQYKTGENTLSTGDLLMLYTDGITEAMNAQQQEYGEERLATLLANSHHLQPQQIIETVLADLQEFSNGSTLSDDRTMLVLKIKGEF